MRPFAPILRNRIQYEVKYGEKATSRGGKTYPQKLKYFKVVSRDRSGDAQNFTKVDEVHDIIGDQPTEIPIVLFSDDQSEVFSIYRGAFDKQTLMCGTLHPSDSAMRRFKMEDTVVENGIHTGGKIVKPLEIVDVPFRYACNDSCPVWQADKCNLHGKLHFMLNLGNNKRDSSFCVLRVAGIFAQMALSSSLDIISNMTGGILAGIPLKLRIDYEKLNRAVVVNGKTMYPDIPYISVEPGLDYRSFMEAVRQEIRERSDMWALTNGGKSPNSIDDILIKNVLSASLNREALFEDAEETVSDVEDEVADTDVVPTKSEQEIWDDVFAGTDIPKRKQELIIQKFENDPEQVMAHLKEEGAYVF